MHTYIESCCPVTIFFCSENPFVVFGQPLMYGDGGSDGGGGSGVAVGQPISSGARGTLSPNLNYL